MANIRAILGYTTMNIVKVYNKQGEHVDSFKKKKRVDHYREWGRRIRFLNDNGFYISSQLNKLGIRKTVGVIG